MDRPTRNYRRRFAVAMTAYVVLLFVAMALVNAAGDALWRFVPMVLPIIGVVAVVWAVARFALEADEMVSGDLARAMAIAFGAGSALTFSYGLLQLVGAPQLNWMFVWCVYAFCWLVAALVLRRGRS